MKTPEEWKELDDKALMRIVRRQPKLEVKPLTTQDRKERYDEFYGEYTTNKNAFYGKAAEDLYLKRQVDSLDSLNRIFYHVCVKEIARYMCADGKKYNVTGAFAQERSIQLLAEGKLTIDNVFNTDATYGPLTIGGWSRGHIDRQYAVNRKYDKHLLKSDKNKRHNPEQDNDIITSYAKLTKELKDAFDGDKSQLKRKRSKKDSNDPEKIIKKVELEKNAETPKNEEEDASWKTSSSAASNNSNNKIESENETKIENEKEKESNLSDDIEPTTPKTPDGLENMFENVFNGGQNEPDFELDELKTAPKTTI
jgi:hypothetical protein